MSNTPREDAYDEHIAPLMKQIIALAKEHKIPMVAGFELDLNEEEGSHLVCRTIIFNGKEGWPLHDNRMREAMLGLHGSNTYSLTETHVIRPDGSKEITIKPV